MGVQRAVADLWSVDRDGDGIDGGGRRRLVDGTEFRDEKEFRAAGKQRHGNVLARGRLNGILTLS